MQNTFLTEFGLHEEVSFEEGSFEEGFFSSLSADIIGQVPFK